MSVSTPIVDFIRRYAFSGTARLHMPGHKGQPFLGFEPLDITEIKGADELYAPEGIIAESEANATRLFGTAHTFYSTEGSSQCIRAMLFLAMQGAPRTNRRPLLLAARNAHKALLYAAALLDFDIQWLWQEASDALCSCPVTEKTLDAALHDFAQQGQLPFGVYVTSPDYLGGMQDIAALAKVCQAYSVPLLVDNAHGAYLRFLSDGSQHPISLGAAMCCDSGHKTLPVVTGGAYLHLSSHAPVQDEASVRNALALFGSTSPSYLILQSLDYCNAYAAGKYPQRLAQCCHMLANLRRDFNAAAQKHGCPVPLVLDGEPLKLTLDAAALGMTGTALAEHLRQNEIECEYADPRYLVLMFTPENPSEDFERLNDAILPLFSSLPDALPAPEDFSDAFVRLREQAVSRCTIRQAMFAPQQRVSVTQAKGRICAMPTVSCPPAIPISVSGEVITPAAVSLMQRYHIREVSVLSE